MRKDRIKAIVKFGEEIGKNSKYAKVESNRKLLLHRFHQGTNYKGLVDKIIIMAQESNITLPIEVSYYSSRKEDFEMFFIVFMIALNNTINNK